MAGQMMLGGLSDGCGELRAGLRQPSGIPRLLSASFGRKQWRDHSGNYLQALLVQDQERRKPRISRNRWASRPGRCSAFSPRPGGPTETVIGRLQEYLAPRWDTRRRCGCSMAATSPSRAGNRREWPGSTAAGWARWPTARVGCSWPTSARWAGRWWTSGCICPRVGPPTRTGVLRRVCRRTGGTTGQRRSWPWNAGAGPGVGLPQGRVGCRRRRLRDVADLPGGTGGPGDALRATFGTTVWPLDPLDQSGISGVRPPPKPKLRPGQRRTMEQRGDECRMRLGGR